MTRLTAQAYTVAWLCALPLSELVAATAMLDEEHDPLSLPTHDENSYTYGSINGHNVVIACIPPGQLSKVSASKLVSPLSQTFRNLKIILFVGVGSGVPRIPPPDNPDADIHLGDVVIGWAEQAGVPGVVQCDLVRSLDDRDIEPLSTLDQPDRRLLNALGQLFANRILGRTRFPEHLKRLPTLPGFSHPGLEHDKLFRSTYHHVGGPDCSSCDHSQLTERLPRLDQDLIFHQGTIVSVDTILKDPQTRDKISQIYHNALCFEMEAAGVMNENRCLIIRGVADYADSHRSSLWQNYAAGTAAAFAREFLFTIPPRGVQSMGEVSVLSSTAPSNTAISSTAKVPFMVPFQRKGDLIGREQHIQSLDTKLCVPNRYCRVALVGLGGIGKTRIALEYAFRQKESNTVSVFWVNASTAEQMERSYKEIAKEARLVESEDPSLDQLQQVKLWLESKESGNWLMVIDNADDENLFYGEDENRGQKSFRIFQKLAQYFPQRPNGSILLTTRNKMLGFKFTSVHGVITIPKMSVSESKGLLVENLEGEHDDQDLTDMVEILENLPLALVQAAAFIKENSQSISDYLQMYRESDSTRIKLLSQDFEDDESRPDSNNPVAGTLAISFEQLRRNNHQAADILSLMSVLDRHAIPKSLLSLDCGDVELEKSLGTLKAFSLITPESSQAFNLHHLVYLAMRNWLSLNKELDSWTGKALVFLLKLFPFPESENQEIWMAYLPHAHTVLNSDYLPPSQKVAQATLLFEVSMALQQKGDYDGAEIMAQKSLDLRERVPGETHIDTLHSLSNLGLIFWRQGKNLEAEKIYRQVLDSSEKMLGNEHSHTLNVVNNLASVLNRQGKFQKAEKLHRRALSGTENTLGKEHPDTLISVSNLASVLSHQGKYEEAEKLYRRALSGNENTLGKEHPVTLMSVDSLGSVLANQGKYEEAEGLHRRTLSDREKILGKEHPYTLTSVNNLGSVLANQAKYEEAEGLHQHALSGRKKVLGKEHPNTLSSVNNLAHVLSDQRNYDEAERLYRRLLGTREKILGYEHPNTPSSINNLADVLSDQGKYDEAEKLYRRGLSAREKVLGERQPDTLSSINDLADVHSDQGKYEAAEEVLRRALSDTEKILGTGHPVTLMSIDNLRSVLANQGKYKEAEELHWRALSARILGKEPPNTLMSPKELGLVFASRGKYEEAELLHRHGLTANEKILGKDHPDTLTSVNDLAKVLQEQGKYKEAEDLHRRTLSAREKVLGERHPDTLTSINNLAHALQKQNLVEEAALWYKRAQNDREITLAREPSDILTSVNSSGPVLGNQGSYEAAEKLHQGAPSPREKIPENYLGIHGDKPHDLRSWHSGSPELVAEPIDSKSDSQNFRDSSPVPPDIRRLHFRSDETVPSQSSPEGNEYSRLGMFDTVVIISDTLSMINPVHSKPIGINRTRRWSILEGSLEYIINIITIHNKDGLDIRFLKNPELNGKNITDPDVLLNKLGIVGGLLQNSSSGTEFLDDLMTAISPCLETFRVWKAAMAERRSLKRPKPLNLIVITDSHASDDSEVTWYLANVAKQLDSMRAPPRQIGVQFVQIGDDEKATSWFRKLDDELGNGKSRDIIDVTPFEYQRSADGDQELFKVLSKIILRKIELGGAKNDIDLEANLYGPLTRIIMSIPSDRIWFSAEDDLSVWNKIKAFVENHTEENWNWWPLRPRMRLLQKDQTRLHWRCHCNTHLWTEISIAQAEKYQFLLSLREGTQQNHLCRLRRRKTSMLAFLAGILHAAGSGSNPRAWFGSLGRSLGTSQQGTRTSSAGSVGQTSIGMTSQGTASSNPQPSQTGDKIARVDQSFVLFGVKGTLRTLELAQIDTYNYASDGEFFGDLKKAYRGLRGYLRYWFSVWQFSHCDFVKFEKSRADRIFFRRKEIPTDSNYEYQPKPPDAEDPPITPHEFELAFALCSTQCLWSVFHDCIEPPSGTLAIERIPKRKSFFELSREDSEVKPAWGLQAQHAVALTQVIFYHVLISTGPFGFWAWWEDQRPTDLQNAAVPLTTVAVFLSLFWSASGLLKMSRQSV